MRRALTLLLMLLALGVVACGDDDSDDGGSGDDSTTTTETQTQTETQPDEEPARKRNGCVEVAQPEPKRDGGEKKPTEELSGDYEVTFETNCGSFTVEIDEELGGLTAASFVQLAESGFYEDTFFHRIVPGFVIQGGDPTGTGFGGPGYTTEDAPPKDAQYPKSARSRWRRRPRSRRAPPAASSSSPTGAGPDARLRDRRHGHRRARRRQADRQVRRSGRPGRRPDADRHDREVARDGRLS